MKKVLIILCLSFMLCACSNEFNDFDVKKIMSENEYIIVDVRTSEEYKESHLKDAINIPYDQLNNTLDKDKIIFVYCRSGTRSKIAYDTLIKLGYNVYDLGAFEEIDLPKS